MSRIKQGGNKIDLPSVGNTNTKKTLHLYGEIYERGLYRNISHVQRNKNCSLRIVTITMI